MGQVQFWEGAVLFVGGMMAMDPACCCPPGPGLPCADCGPYPQGPVVVSVSGNCTASWVCENAPGTYTLDYDFWCGYSEVGSLCEWVFGRGYIDEWENEYPYYLFLTYNKISKTWSAELIFSSSVPQDLWHAGDENISVICNKTTHKLSGTIDLVIIGDLGETICPDCTAQATL